MAVTRLDVAVLISGRGSNLQSIIDACSDPDFPAKIRVVISNEPDAYGLERAKEAGIPTEVVPHKSYPSRKEFEEALGKSLALYPVDLIALAGFMRVLTPDFVSKWEGKMLNIHPSLLPAYPGLHTHERVLAASEKESGCTIHFVTPGLDEGPTLLQKRVPVVTGDTVDTLSARVLEQEHIAYPEAIRLIALGKVKYDKEKVVIEAADPYTPPQKMTAPVPAAPTEKPAFEDKKPSIKSQTKEIQDMDHHNTADNAPDEAAIANANMIWHNFTKLSFWGVLHVVVILILMAIFLL